MTVCSAKYAARSDKATENYHPALQLPSALCSIEQHYCQLIVCF